MKKVFLALAVVAMFSFAACNGNGDKKDTKDTTKKEQVNKGQQTNDPAAAQTATEPTATEPTADQQ
ncbi:MAG: hypothetical protein J6X86_02715 [Bacteroidales bacterium]|nr:hypothetical protein [Bacteroidales bacterium]